MCMIINENTEMSIIYFEHQKSQNKSLPKYETFTQITVESDDIDDDVFFDESYFDEGKFQSKC